LESSEIDVEHAVSRDRWQQAAQFIQVLQHRAAACVQVEAEQPACLLALGTPR
jgi:hypothetical protein